MEEEQGKELNEKQLAFCMLYVSKEFFANGVESYAEAYGINLELPGQYNVAKANAWRLLTNAYILAKINELLELSGMTEEFVDKQLTFIITQNADLSSKLGAIREFNKLKSRITSKVAVELTGIKVTLSGSEPPAGE